MEASPAWVPEMSKLTGETELAIPDRDESLRHVSGWRASFHEEGFPGGARVPIWAKVPVSGMVRSREGWGKAIRWEAPPPVFHPG